MQHVVNTVAQLLLADVHAYVGFTFSVSVRAVANGIRFTLSTLILLNIHTTHAHTHAITPFDYHAF